MTRSVMSLIKQDWTVIQEEDHLYLATEDGTKICRMEGEHPLQAFFAGWLLAGHMSSRKSESIKNLS